MNDDNDDINNNSVGPYMNSNNAETTAKKNIKWRKKPFDDSNLSFPSFEKVNNEDIFEDCPFYYFSQYLPASFFEDTAFYTNKYAQINNNFSFRHTNADEIKDLFALHILMGCIKYPRISMFWESGFRIPAFEIMKERRFYELRSNLHVMDVSNIPSQCTDKFIKVRVIFDTIRSRMLKKNLEEQVCVDEAIIPFKGRLQIKQYIKGKA